MFQTLIPQSWSSSFQPIDSIDMASDFWPSNFPKDHDGNHGQVGNISEIYYIPNWISQRRRCLMMVGDCGRVVTCVCESARFLDAFGTCFSRWMFVWARSLSIPLFKFQTSQYRTATHNDEAVECVSLEHQRGRYSRAVTLPVARQERRGGRVFPDRGWWHESLGGRHHMKPSCGRFINACRLKLGMAGFGTGVFLENHSWTLTG